MLHFFVFVLLILFLFYRRKKHNYWKNIGVPSPKAHFLFGTIQSCILERKPFGFLLADIYKLFPNERFVGIYQFYKPILMITDPELIHRVLIEDSHSFPDRCKYQSEENRLNNHLLYMTGQNWKKIRTKLTPVFSPKKLKSMYPSVQNCAKLLESQVRWE